MAMFKQLKDRSMWFQRLVCFFGGHQFLSLAAVYSQRLPAGGNVDLRYCARCGSAVWAPEPGGPAVPPKWGNMA
jgi:hypothetical protein